MSWPQAILLLGLAVVSLVFTTILFKAGVPIAAAAGIPVGTVVALAVAVRPNTKGAVMRSMARAALANGDQR
ncbi:hypothetical protein [Amycolatopsis japonica]